MDKRRGAFAILKPMATFIPPTDDFVAWGDEETEGIFKYLKAFPRGRNVYKMLDGSFTEYQPSNMDLVEKIYHGGHVHTVEGQEEQDLRDAGYEDYIT